jgi:hypothetical protein
MRLHTKDIIRCQFSLIREFLQLNKKVGFVVAGAQKSGTTALFDFLSTHPELCMQNREKSTNKEVHYFDDDRLFNMKARSDHKYHMHFKPKEQHKIIGDVTPAYMYRPQAAERMFNYNPKLKIIVILKNPIERAFSHWNMQVRRKRDSRTFLEAIKCEIDTPNNTFPHRSKRFSFENRYLYRGLYVEQLMRLEFFFPRQQIHILKNEDLRLNPKEALGGIGDFLGVSRAYFEDLEYGIGQHTKYPSEISRQEWRLLYDYYCLEIERLDAHISVDFKGWRDTPEFARD